MTQQDAIADYATWTEPGTAFQVQYLLPVFHEIDLTVNEGYRRIPHGGIETGGLLFGRRIAEGVRIEAFRPIACEHALGPSFKLSERDLAGLREQIARVEGDPELGGLETVGWFIAHTRGGLQVTDTEAKLFDELLPGAGMLTVLVKPEKFKPTLFSFLVRDANGAIELEGAERAIILPLPGRPMRAVVEAAPPVEIVRAKPEVEAQREVELEPEPEMAVEPKALPTFEAPVASRPPVPLPPAPLATERTQAAPFEWQFDKSPVEAPPLFGGFGEAEGRRARPEPRREGNRSGLLAMVIGLAAVLGAATGYWIYQQMTPAIIQLTVEPQENGVIVSWPPEQTSGAAEAFIRVNDGTAVLLPAEAKRAGRWQVQAVADNLKIELTAQHTLSKSIGIVRYIQPGSGP